MILRLTTTDRRNTYIFIFTAAVHPVHSILLPTGKPSQFPWVQVFQPHDRSKSRPSPLISQRRTSRSISAGVQESGLYPGFRRLECTSRRIVARAHPTAGVPTTWTPTETLPVSYHRLSCKFADNL